MGNNINVLDCTLRDGGYVNDWDFGHSVLTSIYKRLDNAGVEYIEVGFLNDQREFDLNRSIIPNTDMINEIYKNVPKKNAIPVAMIDYGTCHIDNIGKADTTFIDGIRVIFKKEKIDEALPFCQAIKDKGYKLFIQAISITAYSDMEMLQYIERINEIKPYAFSIVDTYGLLDKQRLTKYFYLIDNNMDPEIKLGYHAHNNFQLAFSNSIEFLSMRTERDIIVDATVYGMGKSAGNCPIELMTMHMNQYYDKNYNISQILEIIDTDIMTIYQEKYWGYTYKFYLSALHDCHPNYVQYMLDKKTLSVSDINGILAKLPDDKRLLYDEEYIKSEYIDYQKHEIDDKDVFSKLYQIFLNKKILIIGPGKTILSEQEKIDTFIEEERPLIISVNFSTDLYDDDYIFISNAKRYAKLVDTLPTSQLNSKVIATSNITGINNPITFRINYESLLLPEVNNSDNALILLLNCLLKLKVKEVVLAGFDGYQPGNNNYYKKGYNYVGNEKEYLSRNREMSKMIEFFKMKINIQFLTESLYCR